MTYNLWDTEVGRYLGQFEDEKEALMLVRLLLNDHGDGYAEELGLGRVNEDGEILEPLSGAALLARVNEILPDRQHADERRDVVIASAARSVEP